MKSCCLLQDRRAISAVAPVPADPGRIRALRWYVPAPGRVWGGSLSAGVASNVRFAKKSGADPPTIDGRLSRSDVATHQGANRR
jgi:hypothetical protein